MTQLTIERFVPDAHFERAEQSNESYALWGDFIIRVLTAEIRRAVCPAVVVNFLLPGDDARSLVGPPRTCVPTEQTSAGGGLLKQSSGPLAVTWRRREVASGDCAKTRPTLFHCALTMWPPGPRVGVIVARHMCADVRRSLTILLRQCTCTIATWNFGVNFPLRRPSPSPTTPALCRLSRAADCESRTNRTPWSAWARASRTLTLGRVEGGGVVGKKACSPVVSERGRTPRVTHSPRRVATSLPAGRNPFCWWSSTIV